MNILREVAAELFKMFVGDAWLTLSICGVVGVAAVLSVGLGWPMLGGVVLLLGCVAVLGVSVRRGVGARR